MDSNRVIGPNFVRKSKRRARMMTNLIQKTQKTNSYSKEVDLSDRENEILNGKFLNAKFQENQYTKHETSSTTS